MFVAARMRTARAFTYRPNTETFPETAAMADYMSEEMRSLESAAKATPKTDSPFHLPKHGPGRFYYCPPDMVVKYWEVNSIVEAIAGHLKNFLRLDASVRMLTDGPLSIATSTVIALPFEGDNDRIYYNLAKLIYDQLWGYYIGSDPKGTHHGLTNLVFEGNETSLIRREAEKFLALMSYRTDLAARVMLGYTMQCDVPPINRDTYMRDAVHSFLEVELGVRLFTYGEGVNRATVFLPYGDKTAEAIDRIYYNVEHIVHQNLVAYDELHDHYLPVSTELVVRELEGVMVRARQKGNTRKKIINGLKFHTVLLQDTAMIYHQSLADVYYDKINRIDLLEEAAQRSRELFSTALIRSTELTVDAKVDVNNLQMEERVYIERPKAAGQPATVQRQAPAQARGTRPTPPPRQAQPAAAGKVPTKPDGLSEL
jgi:hypothetical protein